MGGGRIFSPVVLHHFKNPEISRWNPKKKEILEKYRVACRMGHLNIFASSFPTHPYAVGSLHQLRKAP